MSENHEISSHAEEDAALAAPPDHENEAIIDAHKTFIAAMIAASMFIGSVVVFIL
jgi:hypothetical protein